MFDEIVLEDDNNLIESDFGRVSSMKLKNEVSS